MSDKSPTLVDSSDRDMRQALRRRGHERRGAVEVVVLGVMARGGGENTVENCTL